MSEDLRLGFGGVGAFAMEFLADFSKPQAWV